MPKSVTITLAQLEAADACRDQRDLFAATFGDSVTFGNKRKFVAACVSRTQEFRFDWAGENLLSGPARAAYDEALRTALAVYDEALRTARAAYDEARRPALAAYYEALRTADAAYDEARRTAYAAYNEATRPAYDAYDEARRTALAAYKEACAVAFANAYWSQHNA